MAARLDSECRRELAVATYDVRYKQRTVEQTMTSCQRCGGCVVAFSDQLETPTVIRSMEKAFCQPGQRSDAVPPTAEPESAVEAPVEALADGAD